MGLPMPESCAWVREQFSLRLDSELPRLEEMLLEDHLERCVDCRTHAERVAAATGLLRATPLAQPARSFQPSRYTGVSDVSLRRRRLAGLIDSRGFARRAISTAAVGAVALSGLTSLLLSSTPAPGVDLRTVREVRELKERMLEQLDVVAQPIAVRPGLTAVEQVVLGPATPARGSRSETRDWAPRPVGNVTIDGR